MTKEAYDKAITVFKALLKSGDGKRITWERVLSMTANLTSEEQEEYKKEVWDLMCDIRNHPRTKEIQKYLDKLELSEQSGPDIEVDAEKKLCRKTGLEARLKIVVYKTIWTNDYNLPQKIEDYEFNPQPGQTILKVIGDPNDETGTWPASFQCTCCAQIMSANAAKSHFLTQLEYNEYLAKVLPDVGDS